MVLGIVASSRQDGEPLERLEDRSDTFQLMIQKAPSDCCGKKRVQFPTPRRPPFPANHPQGIWSRTRSEYLELRIVLNPIYTGFSPIHTYIPRIKFYKLCTFRD